MCPKEEQGQGIVRWWVLQQNARQVLLLLLICALSSAVYHVMSTHHRLQLSYSHSGLTPHIIIFPYYCMYMYHSGSSINPQVPPHSVQLLLGMLIQFCL